jgi:Domain of unknown function (DUF1707)
MTREESHDKSQPIRIGNDERAAAMAALDEHLAKGRLGVEEYGDRSAAAANALVAGDLATLFTDLPAPHPRLPGIVTRLDDGSGTPNDTGRLPIQHADDDEHPGGWLESWGPRLVAASPILALLLFLATRQWWWFLLIPVVGALLYSGHGFRHRRPS